MRQSALERINDIALGRQQILGTFYRKEFQY